jgi:ABC-2 type transport system permease protein
MRGFVAITRVTLRQLLGGKRLLLFGLLALLPTIVMWFASSNRTGDRVVATFSEAPVAIVFLIVLPVIALVLGAASLGDERRDGTLSFLLLRPLPRTLVAAAKLTAAWLATTGLVGTSAALAAAVVGIRAGDWGYLAPVLVGVALAALAYCSAFMLLGYFSSRAVLIGLVYVFIWENGITAASAALANVSLWRVGLSAYIGLAPRGPIGEIDDILGSVAPGAGGAIAKALVIAVLVVTATGALLRRRDLT